MNLNISNDCSQLCFNKEEFMKDDFSVDKFVSECRKLTSLETMREDLGVYLRVLHSAMVELINKDYADFVNLSSNLVGLDKSIKNITLPLGHLREEVLNVKTGLDESLLSAQKKLREKEGVHKKKVLVQRIMYILEGIEKIEKQNLYPICNADGNKRILSGEVIERVAMELNQLQFHMSKVEGHSLVNENQTKAIKISEILQQHLELIFLDSISNCDTENLRKVLRTYSTIDKVKEIEDKFCRLIVRPYMRKIISEDLIIEHGLQKMFSHVLDFIPTKCKTILEVTRGTKKEVEPLKGYDFLVNAVWPEIVLGLEYIGPVIFAPGNPSLFHHNYCASMEFVKQFEHFCMVQTSVKRLREHPSYKLFMDKWNLLVYFQIRYQEIGGAFEVSLLSAFSSPNVNTPYHLYASYCLWFYVSRCWDTDVFLLSLRHKFWKLTLQLISRFCTWVNSTISSENAILHKSALNAEDSASVNNQCSNVNITRSFKMSDNLESTNQETPLSLSHLIMLVKDVELLLSEVEKLFKEVIEPKLDLHGNEAKMIEEACKTSVESLSDLSDKIGLLIVKHLTVQCAQNLKMVTDIPRLYRKTNREIPSKPSTYVSLVLKPVEIFLCDTGKILSFEWKTKWIQDVIDSVTKQYLVVTSDVITSIKKMEDSLKRLKRARDKPKGEVSGSTTDDDKIRLQLIIDVEHFGKQIENLGLENCDILSYTQLKNLVESAMKSASTNS